MARRKNKKPFMSTSAYLRITIASAILLYISVRLDQHFTEQISYIATMQVEDIELVRPNIGLANDLFHALKIFFSLLTLSAAAGATINNIKGLK